MFNFQEFSERLNNVLDAESLNLNDVIDVVNDAGFKRFVVEYHGFQDKPDCLVVKIAEEEIPSFYCNVMLNYGWNTDNEGWVILVSSVFK